MNFSKIAQLATQHDKKQDYKIADLFTKVLLKYAQEDAPYSSLPYMSVAESIAAMDTDHDGIVSVHEIRVFIESRHGKGYQGKVFDDMEKSAENRSCGSSFTKSLY